MTWLSTIWKLTVEVIFSAWRFVNLSTVLLYSSCLDFSHQRAHARTDTHTHTHTNSLTYRKPAYTFGFETLTVEGLHAFSLLRRYVASYGPCPLNRPVWVLRHSAGSLILGSGTGRVRVIPAVMGTSCKKVVKLNYFFN